ncbi:MAG: sulfatase-like hydrolase/transferase [Flavobacteriaceae bacterium]|nr:sulfatase-like hydrolase/transferase [Flavobacteriaceae bacterium]
MYAKILIYCSCLILLVENFSCTSSLPERPNILFIMTDYQSGQDIPAETEILNMPNLKRLAEEGIIFKNHIATAPICMPSRSTIVTGLYPHSHGIWDNIGKWVPEDSDILMEELVKLGYHTTGIGKMHFTPFDRMAGFDKRIIADGKRNSARDSLFADDYALHLKKAGLTRWDYLKLQNQSEFKGVYDWPFADSLHIDHFVGTKAKSHFETLNTDKPWFAWVSFNGPHNPWDPPKKYTDYYLEKTLPKAQMRKGELSNNPIDITKIRFNYTRNVVDQMDQNPSRQEEYIRRIRAAHYGNLTFIDEQVGKIIETLKQKGELENTIIIWTSDHGSNLGDHNLIHKGTHYDRSARVPFVVWWGKNVKPGERNGFSSHVDLMSTFIDLAGGDPPNSQEGHSMRKMIIAESDGDNHAIVEILGNYSLLTHEYVYGVFPKTNEKVLFDKREDPHELDNQILNPKFVSIADSLETILYNFRPEIQQEFAQHSSLQKLPNSVVMVQGGSYKDDDIPYLGGKPLKIEGSFTYENGQDGPLFVFHEGRTHGLSMYIKNGILYCGFRTWTEDHIEKITILNLDKNNDFEVDLDHDGQVSITLNGKNIKQFQSPWPMPVQPGNINYLTGNWDIGTAGSKGFTPIGDYRKEHIYSGNIYQVQIQILN